MPERGQRAHRFGHDIVQDGTMKGYADAFHNGYPKVDVEFAALADYEAEVKIRMNTENYDTGATTRLAEGDPWAPGADLRVGDTLSHDSVERV